MTSMQPVLPSGSRQYRNRARRLPRRCSAHRGDRYLGQAQPPQSRGDLWLCPAGPGRTVCGRTTRPDTGEHMNASLMAALTDAELLLIAETDPAPLADLDEDAALELEARIRRARDKYT